MAVRAAQVQVHRRAVLFQSDVPEEGFVLSHRQARTGIHQGIELHREAEPGSVLDVDRRDDSAHCSPLFPRPLCPMP